MIPSDEQLAHFAAVRCFGPGVSVVERRVALALIRSTPGFREAWLREHAAFQAELRRASGAAA